ncbi:MAG: 50S ribosomal protein L10 [Chloroflexia bacterium]
MATKKKKETVKELNHLFASSEVLIFTDYRGLKVADITNLRRILRDKGVEFHVTKNTLAELAANRSGMDSMIPMLDGPTAIAFVGEDIPGAAKALTDFVRTSKILQIRGGLMGNKTISAEQVTDLTKILTKEQYIAQLMGAMRAPIQNFVNVLNAPLQGFVNVLNARLDKLKESGEGATSTLDAGAEPVGSAETDTGTAEAETAVAEDMSPTEAEPEGFVDADAAEAETAETETAEAETDTTDAS